jgi:hypothetical protein
MLWKRKLSFSLARSPYYLFRVVLFFLISGCPVIDVNDLFGLCVFGWSHVMCLIYDYCFSLSSPISLASTRENEIKCVGQTMKNY